MADFDDILEDLKQKRDELRVQMHLASKEAQEEWEELKDKMKEFSRRAQLERTGDEVGEALGNLGREIKQGYQRLRNAVRNN